MGRAARNRNPMRPEPVERIELSNRHLGWRLLAVVLFLALGIGSITYGVMRLVNPFDPGWAEIEASTSAASCAEDFVLLYELGVTGQSASSESKALTRLYNTLTVKAYQLFNNAETFDNLPNVRYLNDHPGETVTVDEALYRAFEAVEASGNRALYLAPVAELYDNLFTCQDDVLTVDFDPLLNDDLRAFFAEAAAFARDPGAVSVALLDDGQVRLDVSDAYLAFAQEEEISSFIDFHWMRNAFIIDYLADALIAQGYTYGTLSSYDGFARALDSRATSSYSYNLFDGQSGTVQSAAIMRYTGAKSIVALRSYPLSSGDSVRYYVRQDGAIRTAYLDPADGLSRTAIADLTAYADGMGCADILLRVAPAYIADTLDERALADLEAEDIHTIHLRNRTIVYTDPELQLTDLAAGYRSELMQ